MFHVYINSNGRKCTSADFSFTTVLISLRPPQSVESLTAILKETEAVPTYLPNCLLLRDAINRATEWLKEAEAVQVKHTGDLSFCINAGYLLMLYPK